MPEKNRTFEANLQTDRPLKLQPRPKQEERLDTGMNQQDLNQPGKRRVVVERLIEWFKQE